MTEHLTDVDQLAAKDQFSAVKEFDEWNEVTGALPDHTSWNYECRSIMEDADKEIERLRTALTGISTCSTCEACRGAARLALGAPSTTGEGLQQHKCVCGILLDRPDEAHDCMGDDQ